MLDFLFFMLSNPQLCSAALKANRARLVILNEGTSLCRKDGKFVFSVTSHWATSSLLQAQAGFPGFLMAFSPAVGEISSLGWNCISRGGEGAAPRGDAADLGAPAELTPRCYSVRWRNLRSSPTSPWSALITRSGWLHAHAWSQKKPHHSGVQVSQKARGFNNLKAAISFILTPPNYPSS